MRTALASAALLSFACQSTHRLDLAAQPDDWLVVANREGAENGDLEQAVLAPADQPLLLTASGAVVGVWLLHPSDFIHPDGEPLTAAEWRQARVRLLRNEPQNDPFPMGDCGRCLVPAIGGPQIVHPGDRCAIPPNVKGQIWNDGQPGDPALEPSFRDQLTLEWPGPCICPLPKSIEGTTADFDVELIYPKIDPGPPETIALGPDGSAALFSHDSAIRIDAAGVRTVLPPAKVPFGPSVFLSQALPDGRFVVVSRSPLVGSEILIDVLAARTLEPLLEKNYAGRISSVRTEHAQGHLLFPGAVHQPGDSPALYECTIDLASCGILTAGNLLQAETDFFVDAEITDDGAIIAATARGNLVEFEGAPTIDHLETNQILESTPIYQRGTSQEAGGRSYAWIGFRHSEHLFPGPGPGESHMIQFFSASGRIGSRVFLCGHAPAASAGAPIIRLVLSATVSSARIAQVDTGLLDAWRVIDAVPDQDCGNFVRIPGHPDQIRLASLAHRTDFDAAGNILTEGEDLTGVLRIDSPPFQLATTTTGWSLVLDQRLSVLRSARPGDPFVRLYGDPEGVLGRSQAVALVGDDFWVFGSATDPVRVTRGANAGFTPERLMVRGLDPLESVTAAAFDSMSGEVILAGRNPGGAWLRRLDPTQLLAAPFGLLSPDLGAINAIAELLPGTLIATSTGGQLLVIEPERGTVRTVPLPVDDLGTPGVDSGLTVIGCPPWELLVTASPGDAWRGLSVSAGVGWVGGCGGRLFRITHDGERVRAERISLDRLRSSNGDPQRINVIGVDAFCPDNVLLLEQAEISGYGLSEIAPDTRDLKLIEAGLPIVDVGTPSQLIGPASAVLLEQSHGISGVHDTTGLVVSYELGFTAGAVNRHNDLLFAGTAGRLLLARPR